MEFHCSPIKIDSIKRQFVDMYQIKKNPYLYSYIRVCTLTLIYIGWGKSNKIKRGYFKLFIILPAGFCLTLFYTLYIYSQFKCYMNVRTYIIFIIYIYIWNDKHKYVQNAVRKIIYIYIIRKSKWILSFIKHIL